VKLIETAWKKKETWQACSGQEECTQAKERGGEEALIVGTINQLGGGLGFVCVGVVKS